MKKKPLTSWNKILIVDDEGEIGLLLKRVLRKKFESIEHVPTLQQALDNAQSFQPNVILLDNNLPDGSGIERIGSFNKTYPDASIIIISAMTHLRDQAIENGAFAFVEKPLSLKRVLEAIYAAIG